MGTQTQNVKLLLHCINPFNSFQINLVFFLGILRILVGKLKMSDAHRNEFSQYK